MVEAAIASPSADQQAPDHPDIQFMATTGHLLVADHAIEGKHQRHRSDLPQRRAVMKLCYQSSGMLGASSEPGGDKRLDIIRIAQRL